MTAQGEIDTVERKIQEAQTLTKVLGNIKQGDLISLGAVTLVGVGTSPAWTSTLESKEKTVDAGEEIWSLMIDSDVGWYVVITQDCDIVREPALEPAIVVCPLKYISDQAWQNLRSGPGSPREFPFPDGRWAPDFSGFKPAANLRFVTSVDKTALLHPSVIFKHPLSGPQRATFGSWVGARYARTPHPDALERDVLPKAAARIQKLSAKFQVGVAATPEVRLVAATERWYLGGNDKRVLFIPMVSESSLKMAQLWNDTTSEADEATIGSAAKKLTNLLRAGLPSGLGYTCAVEPTSLHGATAADLLEWSEWVVEIPPDPLAE